MSTVRTADPDATELLERLIARAVHFLLTHTKLGITIVTLLAGSGIFTFLALANLGSQTAGGPTVVDVGEVKQVVPAQGIQGFRAKFFCEDDATQVKSFISPDAGTTYQMTRLKDGKTETVTAVYSGSGALVFGTHYYDTTAGQQSEPADMTGALDCMLRKAK